MRWDERRQVLCLVVDNKSPCLSPLPLSLRFIILSSCAVSAVSGEVLFQVLSVECWVNGSPVKVFVFLPIISNCLSLPSFLNLWIQIKTRKEETWESASIRMQGRDKRLFPEIPETCHTWGRTTVIVRSGCRETWERIGVEFLILLREVYSHLTIFLWWKWKEGKNPSLHSTLLL